MKWAQVTVTTSEEASEAVANQLFALNSIGIVLQDNHTDSSRCVSLVSYFPMDDLVGARVRKIQQFLEQLPQWGLSSEPAAVSLAAIKNTDWSEKWRSGFPIQKIGKRITVAPTWTEMAREPSDISIQLDPGMAFGTGQHPTTRLSMILLEKTIKGNELVADIGTGSGILSITAAKLGAGHIDAIDSDDATFPTALNNIRLNGVQTIVRLQTGEGLKPLDCRYNLIVSNILTKVLLPMIPEMVNFLKPTGEIILSGIMKKESKQIEKALNAHEFQTVDVVNDADWIGLRARLRNKRKNPHS